MEVKVDKNVIYNFMKNYFIKWGKSPANFLKP